MILLQTEQIVEPLFNLEPLLGVIATMFLVAIVYLVYQLRKAEKERLSYIEERKEYEKEIRNLAISNVEVVTTLGSLTEKMIEKMDDLSDDVKMQLQTSLSKIMHQLESLLQRVRDIEQ